MIINRKRIIGGGSTPAAVSRSDVNFYDYDGTLLFAYTIAQANALAALPTAPTHTGLTFQEWNYTLAQVNAATRDMDVGATYITDDGKTRLYIALNKRLAVPLYFSQTVTNGVTIDWGDGSATETLSGTGAKNKTHTYSAGGEYVIVLNSADGCTLGLGNGTDSSVIGGTSGGYVRSLRKAEIGARTIINTLAFANCKCLKSISVPTSITTINSTAFYGCGLNAITIPRGVSVINAHAFASCYLLTISFPYGLSEIATNAIQVNANLLRVILPDGLTTIGAGAVNSCETLSAITVPSGVTSIGNQAFQNCTFMKEYHFLSTTPPTLGGSSVFTSIPSDCIIYVPMASVDAYKAASYWSTHASKIVGE